ncbi:LCP family protein [Heyndrickxia acidiproducens]|uniref:LCP family protein n=1 Tax=Heyndrickxia acidiproducens TaxID=1121084 RepID=UPI00036FE880|nr:LCP family protein [Heyndrickxia acidiproducens]
MDSRITNKKKKRKRIRWRRIFLLLFLLLVVFGAVYTAYQYYAGVRQTKKGDALNMDDVAFNGKKDANGRTNILLLGIDTRGEEKSRTDTIMVAQYDPETNKVKLVSLMRDMYVAIPGYQNYKINTAYFLGGPELLRKTIKTNFNIDIQYYAIVDFKGFVKIVDTLAPEGIEMNVEHQMSKNIGMTLYPGKQLMHGKELLAYARFRKDAQGDFGRVARQQKVLKALQQEVFSVNGIAKAPKLLGTIQPYISTNMSKMNMLGLVKDVIVGSDLQVKTLTVPISGTYSDGYYPQAGAVLDIDKTKNTEAIETFLNE